MNTPFSCQYSVSVEPSLPGYIKRTGSRKDAKHAKGAKEIMSLGFAFLGELCALRVFV
jgi:hypothetical protein